MKDKVSKGKADQGDLDVLEKANRIEILNFNKTCSHEVSALVVNYVATCQSDDYTSTYIICQEPGTAVLISQVHPGLPKPFCPCVKIDMG